MTLFRVFCKKNPKTWLHDLAFPHENRLNGVRLLLTIIDQDWIEKDIYFLKFRSGCTTMPETWNMKQTWRMSLQCVERKRFSRIEIKIACLLSPHQWLWLWSLHPAAKCARLLVSLHCVVASCFLWKRFLLRLNPAVEQLPSHCE